MSALLDTKNLYTVSSIMFTNADIFAIIYTLECRRDNVLDEFKCLLDLRRIILMAKENAHNGKQVNATRLELFIALQYLLEKCPDKEHTSKTVDLQQYAEDKFNVLLDRRRVNDIFDSLMDFTTKHPKVLPYVIKQVEDKPRYYIKKTLFNNKEIESIAKAIQNDTSISTSKAEKYADAFLNVACNEADKEKINKKLKKSEMRKLRVSDFEMKVKENYEYLRDMQMRFYFKFKRVVKRTDCTDYQTFKLLSETERNKEHAGIVFEVYTVKKQTDVCIYLPDMKQAVIAHMEDIELNTAFEPVPQLNTVSFYIGEEITLSDWVNNYYKGSTGQTYPIRFAFPAGLDNTILRKHLKSFEAFFNEQLKYEIKERKVKKELSDGRTEEAVVNEVFATTKHNYESFRKWFWESESKPYETVVVLFPSAFNDRLLGPITRRFQAVIDNFGFNSEHGKTEREVFEKRIAELKKKKEAEASQSN